MDRSITYLDDSLSYYIYGAGTLGKLVGDFLIKAGFEIRGYIDKRAEEIKTLNGVSIFSLNELARNKEKNICVFIAVKDVFEHEKIKNKLLEKGINKIVYRPRSILDGKGTESEKEINGIYDALTEYFLKKNTVLPLAENGYLPDCEKEWILEETEECMTVYVPCELVYTNYDKKEKYTWGNVCIFGLVPHIELFRFFSGNEKYSEEMYVEFCIQNATLQGVEITDMWKRNVLRNRNNVFRQMFYYWSVDRDFFVRNAPTAKWNKIGLFNLTSGKHRASFLAAMGQKWIPLRISKEDYRNWKNEIQFTTYKSMVTEKKILPKLSVEHPLLMDQRNEEYQFWSDILAIIEFYICKLTLDGNYKPSYRDKSFYCNCNSEGYIERNLEKFGLKVVSNRKEDFLEEYANRLLYAHSLDINSTGMDSYDFGLVDYRNENGTEEKIQCEFAILEEDKNSNRGQDGKLLYKNYYGDCLIKVIIKYNEGC